MRPISRRAVLRGFGSVAIALPLLEAMGCANTPSSDAQPSSRRAALTGATKRFVGISIPNGVVPATWFPTGSGKSFTLPKTFETDPDFKMPNLGEYKSDLILFKGLENTAGTRPDTLDGVAHVGLIGFRMVGLGFGYGPPVPYLGTFWETNVRLYSVDDAGRPAYGDAVGQQPVGWSCPRRRGTAPLPRWTGRVPHAGSRTGVRSRATPTPDAAAR